MAAYRSDLNMSTTLFLNTRNLSSIYASLDRFSAHIEWWPAVLQTYNTHTHTLTHTHDCTIPSSVKREMYCCSDLRQMMRLYSRQLHCKRKKTQVQRGEIRLFLIAKGYRLIHWMKALKQATVTLQNTTKKDTVKFPRKKCHSFNQKKGIHMKEHRRGSVFTPWSSVPWLHKNKRVSASSFRMFKNVLQTSC